MYRKTILTALISSSISLSAQAEQSLEPIIVTATRTAQTVDASLASVTVITREEIERLQPAQLVDLLQHRAGISITENGAFGKTTSLFMRGTNSGHTLLLIDGVRMGSATTGGASWQFLSPSEIERIEIVRGPRASIYGADAIGGVVQIFTRQGSEGATRVNAHTRIGSFNTREVSAGARGGNKRTRYSLSATHHETDGINIQDDSGDDRRDGYRNTSMSWQLSHTLGSDLELFTSGMHSLGKSDFDANNQDSAHYNFEHNASKAGLRGLLSANWFSEFAISQSMDKSSAYHENTLNNRYDTVRSQADWRNDISLGHATQLTLGIDWLRDQVSSTIDYEEKRRDNQGIYAIIQTTLDRHNLQTSLRYDDNEAFGDHTTGQAAWGYALTDSLSSRLTYATAFKAPNFNELYFPDIYWGFYFGNPDLKPEKSETYEAGLRYSSHGLGMDISVFQTNIDDLIAGWAPPQNIQKARIQGVEAEITLAHLDWSASLAATIIDAENLEDGNELPRRPRESLRLDLDRKLAAFSLGGSVIARGPSYDNTDNTEHLAGYALLNLRASWQPAPNWIVRGSINNALDKEYQTAHDYNQPGQAAYLSVHYQQ